MVDSSKTEYPEATAWCELVRALEQIALDTTGPYAEIPLTIAAVAPLLRDFSTEAVVKAAQELRDARRLGLFKTQQALDVLYGMCLLYETYSYFDVTKAAKHLKAARTCGLFSSYLSIDLLREVCCTQRHGDVLAQVNKGRIQWINKGGRFSQACWPWPEDAPPLVYLHLTDEGKPDEYDPCLLVQGPLGPDSPAQGPTIKVDGVKVGTVQSVQRAPLLPEPTVSELAEALRQIPLIATGPHAEVPLTLVSVAPLRRVYGIPQLLKAARYLRDARQHALFSEYQVFDLLHKVCQLQRAHRVLAEADRVGIRWTANGYLHVMTPHSIPPVPGLLSAQVRDDGQLRAYEKCTLPTVQDLEAVAEAAPSPAVEDGSDVSAGIRGWYNGNLHHLHPLLGQHAQGKGALDVYEQHRRKNQELGIESAATPDDDDDDDACCIAEQYGEEFER